MLSMARPLQAATSILMSFALAGCGAVTSVRQGLLGSPQLGTPAPTAGFLGGVAADEPRAVQIGRQILAQGGSAADAAAAVGFALAVTLPSRAGLGAGGACLAYSPGPATANHGVPEAIVFTSRAPVLRSGDRPAAAPMLAGGLRLLHTRYGVLPIQQIIAPAEQLARFGTPVSRALAHDLTVVGGALLADPAARRVFSTGGAQLSEGDLITQADLSSTLAGLRVLGVADRYGGSLSAALITGSRAAGGPFTQTDLENAQPQLATPLTTPAGAETVAFLPPPADGGPEAAAAFERLRAAPTDLEGAQARAIAAASDPRHGALGALPASTSFVTLDRTGGAVACAISMGNLFGTGRIVAGTGMLLAASPAALPPPLLAAALAWNRGAHAFRAEVAGSGQEGAPLGVAVGMTNALSGKTAMPSTVPEPGRINAIACARMLPGNPDQCTWATDPRGDGFAIGSN